MVTKANTDVRAKKWVPVWNFPVHLIICDDITLLNQWFDIGMVKNDHAVTFLSDDKIYIGLKRSKITPGTIAHEAKHAVNMAFEMKGVHLKRSNDEPECYLLGYLVDWIHNVINKNDISWKK